MILSNSSIEYIRAFLDRIKNQINNEISKHDTKTGSVSVKGHVQAGTNAGYADVSGGSVGTDNGKYARADHQHSLSSAYASASHTHTISNITNFPSTMTPSSHTHGNITNDGKIGTTANKPIITGTNGVLQAGSFETTATNIKMNGTQSVGSSNNFARSDHVHPVDTSRAASNHTHSGTYLTASDLLEKIYPKGSIYMSLENRSPAEFLGGTWERLQDRFLLGASSSYPAGDPGGEATHTLTSNEMPNHTHEQNAHNHAASEYNFVVSNVGAIYTGKELRKAPTASDGKYYWQTTDYPVISVNSTTANAVATNQPTGGGAAHNNMPPYLAVYMWRRTK